MSSKGAKRSRRVAGDAPDAPAPGDQDGARGGGPASSAAAPTVSTAIVRTRLRASTAVEEGADSAGGVHAAGITAADVSRIVEEQLRALQRDHARELAAVRLDHKRLASDHARLAKEHARLASDHSRLELEIAAVRRELATERREHASELSDARYEASRRLVLLDSGGAMTEIGLVCRRGGGSGPDDYNEYRSVLSVLFGFQEFDDLGDGLMRFFTTKEARELRLVHSEFLDAVNATPWHDTETFITGPVAAWRACFPNAQAAIVAGRTDICDEDFVHFRGLRSLIMSECKGVSDAALVNLRGIESLDMSGCDQPGITAGAFTHLKGMQELEMSGCNIAITIAATSLLREARSLIPTLENIPFIDSIYASDVPECRRLQATRALGSACWLYAGVTFCDLPAPSTAYDVLAAACLELLQVGLEVKSIGIVREAVRYILYSYHDDLSRAACITAGVIQALIAALEEYGTDAFVFLLAGDVLNDLTCTVAGRVACGAAGSARSIVSALKFYATNAVAIKVAFDVVANISNDSSANVESFVSMGAVFCIVAAFQKCAQEDSLCEPFSRALHKLACFPCGVEACLAAGAAPLLAAAYAKDEPARVHAEAALQLLGFDRRGVRLAR